MTSAGARPRGKTVTIAAFTMSLAGASALFGYEIIRTITEALFIDTYGAARLPWVMAAVPPTLILMLYIYGRILSVVGARNTLILTQLMSAAVIFGGYALLAHGYTFATALLYVFREAYIVLIIEQFWSFLMSTLGSQRARQLNGPICGMSSLGAIAGGLILLRFLSSVGSEPLLLFAGGSLIPGALFSLLAYRLAGEPQPSQEEVGGRQGHMGLRVLLGSRYLSFLGLLILSTQVVSVVTQIRFSGLIEMAIPDKDAITAFLGSFYVALNATVAVLQFVAAPILLRYLSMRIIHLGIPIILLGACGLLTVMPTLWTGAAAYFLFKAFDYSIFRAAKEIFYIPLSYDARYRAKAIIDVFGHRSGKGGSSMVFAVLSLFMTIPWGAYAITAIFSALAWIGLVSNLTAQHSRLESASTELDVQPAG